MLTIKNVSRLLCTVSVAACFTPTVVYADVSSRFDTGTEGWLLSGDTTSALPSYISTGGNPGGYIHGIDTAAGDTWYWQAPATFLGNVSSAYGRSFNFDMRMRGGSNIFSDSDVVLAGAGLTLAYDFNYLPANVVWTSFSVILSETAAWRVGSLSGPLATQMQIQSVLSNLTLLRIRGEFISGADNGDLDNVILSTVPEPTTYAMYLCGFGLLGFGVHRQRQRLAVAAVSVAQRAAA